MKTQGRKWRRAFALLPITVDGDSIWLAWYWRRFMGDCYEVSFTKESPSD